MPKESKSNTLMQKEIQSSGAAASGSTANNNNTFGSSQSGNNNGFGSSQVGGTFGMMGGTNNFGSAQPLNNPFANPASPSVFNDMTATPVSNSNPLASPTMSTNLNTQSASENQSANPFGQSVAAAAPLLASFYSTSLNEQERQAYCNKFQFGKLPLSLPSFEQK